MNIGRNQFLFSSCGKDIPAVNCEYKLLAGNAIFFLGEDCCYTQCAGNGREAVLLGYCIHASEPLQTSKRMCDTLLDELDDDCRNAAELTKYWGGRWVLFVYIGNAWYIWNDTCGLKQCFCCELEQLTAASQARYLAWLHNLPENPLAVEYMCIAKKANKEYCWPLNATLYNRVNRILPNHIWKQGDGRAVRMGNILPAVYASEPGNRALELLQGAMWAAEKHKPLVLTLTAGWDSRLVLAAGENAGTKIQTVTLQYEDMADSHPDLVVAQNIAESKRIPHRVLRCTHVDDFFAQKYRAHSENAHDYWIQMARQTYDGGFGQYLWVKGACNEILRNPNGILYNWQISAKILCKLFQLPQTEFLLQFVKNWLAEARPYCKQNRIRLLDLFYWEHRMGSWLAECLNEADMASDMFSPFNTRAYLAVGYRVSWKERVAPNYILFSRMMRNGHYDGERWEISRGRHDAVTSKVKMLLKQRFHLLYGIILRLG